MSDPLAILLTEYRAAVKALNEEPAKDRATNQRHANLINEKLERIEAWSQPALTRESAMMALREAHHDMTLFEPDGPALALVAAALAFFETSEAATTSTAHVPSELEGVIAAFLAALADWYATKIDGNLPDAGPEVDAYNSTSRAFIHFQCTTDAEVQRKLQFVASCQDMKEEVEGGRWFGDFNASLILPVVADPIIAAIAEFHAAIATFADAARDKSNEVCEAIAETTYSAPLDRLTHWTDPVKSRDGAVAAIRFAREEVLTFDAPETVRSMVLAVAAYFDAVATKGVAQ